ncbi:MAG: M14 family metallocarboxypeptidase [Clostridia bacterium]|nr:M14 family metallocarboxypeptidase [Clostridia bacterium]
MGYDYKQCVEEMREFSRKKGAEMFSIGESVMEKKIYCVTYGEGEKKLFLNGAHHGLEYITSAFLMRFLFECEKAISNGEDMFGYRIKELLKNVKLYIVPMVNPDGVDIAVNGLDITNRYHRHLISMVGIHSFNKVWQANARGVDINHNYDALWAEVSKKPSPTKYSGEKPESEPETKAIADFVRAENFDMLIAFHSQGEEIYYDFDGMAGEEAKKIAEKLSEVSGYPVRETVGTASFGGLKDWFIKEYGKMGFTVEMGRGKNPLDTEKLSEYYDANARLILEAMIAL